MRLVTASKLKKEIAGPALDDLHGLGEAGEWGRELAKDLADWRVGKIGWQDVDRGILLSGPPGTGKTTDLEKVRRARSVAPSAPLLIGSGINAQTIADYLPFADGFIVGTSLKTGGVATNPVDAERVRELIRRVSQNGPTSPR